MKYTVTLTDDILDALERYGIQESLVSRWCRMSIRKRLADLAASEIGVDETGYDIKAMIEDMDGREDA